MYFSQLGSSTWHSSIFNLFFFLQEVTVKTAYEAGWQLSIRTWIHASIKHQCHTPQAIHICSHRTASVARHLPVYILLSAANSSTAVLFHIAVDRRLNVTSDSSILLLTFIKTIDHLRCIWDQTGDCLIINFYCLILYLPHLCNTSIIWFPTVIHTSYSLILSIKPWVSLRLSWVYACQMFSASSAEARPLDSGKELPVTPGVGLAWLLGWTGSPQHQKLPLKEIRNVSSLALQERLSSNITFFKSWNWHQTVVPGSGGRVTSKDWLHCSCSSFPPLLCLTSNLQRGY